MMIVTPGTDLRPMEHGADYVYVLDRSGSMDGKFDTMTSAVVDSFSMLTEGETAFESCCSTSEPWI